MRGVPRVAVTVLGLLAAACGGGAPTAHATPSSPPSTRTPSAGGGTTAPAAPTSSASPKPSPSLTPATAPATPPAPAPSQPAATAAARTAAPTPVPGPCSMGDVSLETTTDLPRYAPGQSVQVSVVVRNQSTHGCVFATPGDFTIDAEPAGPSVFAVHLDCPPANCPPLAPGQMSTYPITWNQVANTGPTASQTVGPGSYHARAAFSGYPVSTSASFTIG